MAIILESLRSFIGLKQQEHESLQDYTKRFKTSRDVLWSHIGGPILSAKYITTMKDYDEKDPVKTEKCAEVAYQQLLAYTHTWIIVIGKIWNLIDRFTDATVIKNKQYPKTVTEANNLFRNHHFDKTYNANKRHQDNKSKEQNTEEKEKEEAPEMSFANIEGKCYCCGKGGHKSPA
jgi:hypothetical protein